MTGRPRRSADRPDRRAARSRPSPRPSLSRGLQLSRQWRRAAEMEALHPRDVQTLEGLQLRLVLDAFGDDRCIDLGGERDECTGQRAAYGILVDVAGERDVELDDVRSQAEQVPEAGIAGAGVVEGQPGSALAQWAQ